MNNKTFLADLHTHSTYTDGSYTPQELVKLAKKSSLSALAITDHDNINAYHEAKAAAQKAGIKLFTGIEMSVNFRGGRMHILGLGFDINSPDFQADYRHFRQPKESCAAVIMDYLNKQGLTLTMADLLPYIKNNAIDRYTFFRYFTAQKIFSDAQLIWDNYLNPAVQNINLNIEASDAITIIKRAGGITSLAHFHKTIGLKRFTNEEKDDCFKELKALGLDAVEAQYPDFTAADREFIECMIQKYSFAKTGGTDFHGANRPQVKLGHGIDNNVAVPLAWTDRLRQY